MIGVISDGEDMRWHLIPSLSLVHIDNLLSIDRQPLVRIDSDTEESRVGL